MIQAVKLDPPRIPGPFSPYLGAHECAVLVALVRSVLPTVMIEFGCNTGRTACRVLDNVPTLRTYIGIDVPSGFIPKLSCQRSEVPWHAGYEAAKHGGRFWIQECERGSIVLEKTDLEPADAIFIDGDHSNAGVTCDSVLARSLLNPGGIIIWHDYGNRAVEVTGALDRLHEHGWPIQRVNDTWLAFMRNNAPTDSPLG